MVGQRIKKIDELRAEIEQVTQFCNFSLQIFTKENGENILEGSPCLLI
jgi:hypothetical protein